MNEDFLHYVWEQKLFYPKAYQTDTGEYVEIIDVGIKNKDAGPDFFNAKILSENTIWAGNIEIHNRSSDWYKHKHHINKEYNNVILHVVSEYDKECINSLNNQISTIEIEIPNNYIQNYEQLLKQNKWIGCEKTIKKVDAILRSLWKEKLAIERLEFRTWNIKSLLKENNFNWEEAFYQLIARSFGFGVNSQPFHMLAKSIPLRIITKHKNSLSDIESLLFGQSGILDLNEISDDYTRILYRDYVHLKNKYKLKPIAGFLWKFLRLRPLNFPTLRIAQFANLIYNTTHLLSRTTEANNYMEIFRLFNVNTSDYWKTHYLFGRKSPLKNKKMGTESVNSIIINSVIPFLYLYGCETNNSRLKEKTFQLLYEIPAEKNNIVSNWKKLGFYCGNCFDSQALIHLKKEYCEKRKCLNCMIGNSIIRKKS